MSVTIPFTILPPKETAQTIMDGIYDNSPNLWTPEYKAYRIHAMDVARIYPEPYSAWQKRQELTTAR